MMNYFSVVFFISLFFALLLIISPEIYQYLCRKFAASKFQRLAKLWQKIRKFSNAIIVPHNANIL